MNISASGNTFHHLIALLLLVKSSMSSTSVPLTTATATSAAASTASRSTTVTPPASCSPECARLGCICTLRGAKTAINCTNYQQPILPKACLTSSTVSLTIRGGMLNQITVDSLKDAVNLEDISITNCTNFKFIELNAMQKLEKLQTLTLNSNGLTTFEAAKYLSRKANLRSISLASNKLVSVTLASNNRYNFTELHTYDVSHNKLVELEMRPYVSAPKLRHAPAHGNPLKCDCYGFWIRSTMQDWIRRRQYPWIHGWISGSTAVYCGSPAAVVGRRLANISMDDFTCGGPSLYDYYTRIYPPNSRGSNHSSTYTIRMQFLHRYGFPVVKHVRFPGQQRCTPGRTVVTGSFGSARCWFGNVTQGRWSSQTITHVTITRNTGTSHYYYITATNMNNIDNERSIYVNPQTRSPPVGGRLTPGQIAGIVIGCLLGVGVIAGIVSLAYFAKAKKMNRAQRLGTPY